MSTLRLPRALMFFLLAAAITIAACQPIRPQGTAGLPSGSGAAAPTPPPGAPALPGRLARSLIIQPVVTQPPTPVPSPTLPSPTPTPELVDGPLTLGISDAVPPAWSERARAVLGSIETISTRRGTQALRLLEQSQLAAVQIRVMPYGAASHPVAYRVFAVVAPFATIRDNVSIAEVAQRWQGNEPLLVEESAAPLLRALWGAEAAEIVGQAELVERLENTPGALGIVPFDLLDPRLKVLALDGMNVLSNQLAVRDYPLAVALSVEGAGASIVRPLLEGVIQPTTNRDPARLTQLVMTGVTAMSRVTALRMDQKGYDYPAQVISDVFAAADITHISNEVPFLDDCVANPTENNLILCSDTDYWATLAAMGTDIVGLSGNHVNDFGREGARRSLQWYRDNNIPIYGGGMNVDEACAPLLWEDHGNTFAFIAVLAFGPPGAWATPDEPGACYYYENKERILALVRQLAGYVDIVAVELQHTETYEPYPIASQIAEFRELREAGADIVTGVQSHVPQAQEPYGQMDAGGAGMLSYGLGNLFFDQMWSWATRTELAARHTIYDGRLLNSELLTMVLEDFAQPRWATAEERAGILSTIFAAAPPRP